jgi:hypothetical protein
MEYERVQWDNDNPDMPVDIYSELDDDRWEVRKVEVFADGRMQYSDGVESTGKTGLSEVPMPAVDETNSQEPLTATVIDEDTFEDMWERATRPGADQSKS